MKITVLPAGKLTANHVAAWAGIQRAEPTLASPYFRPEFTQSVAAVRDDVEVGILEQDGESVGFFPFQRDARNVARPVGGKISDFHGVIARCDLRWNAEELLRGCGLAAWHFDHLPVSQEPLRRYHWTTDVSPYIDLSQGFEAYRHEHKEWFKRIGQRSRRAAREAGAATIKLQSTDRRVFQKMVQWKIEQYRRTRVPNVLAYPWSVDLLEHMLTQRGEGFSGMMSALYLGDILSAVLLSIRSHDVLHAWFSAYDPSIAQVSPGLVLWHEFLPACAALGIQRIDLGKGPEDYKRALASGTISLAEGSVDLRPLTGAIRRNWHHAYQWARRSPLRKPLLTPGKMLRSLVGRRSYR